MSRPPKSSAAAACLCLFPTLCVCLAGEPGSPAGKGNPARPPAGSEVFLTEIPRYRGNVILGRPSDHSITLSVLLQDEANIEVAYGSSGTGLQHRTGILALHAGEPQEIVLDGLAANTPYQYRIFEAKHETPLLPERGNGQFQTCRAPGSPFTFTVQADSHLDGSCLPELYKACLANALADKPDFHIDLGDTFMTGKHPSRETAARQYAAQRYYLGLLGQVAPIFLVIGNHDGEECRSGGAADLEGLAVWAGEQRKRCVPNPVPDTFYTGNAQKHPRAGLLQNYYAWTWGDALFVVLDPYWTSWSTHAGKDPWNMSIGPVQYRWLTDTLRASNARYKFVFIHQLVGGLDRGGRGGAEAALLFEWGGHELDGRQTFAIHRVGWEKPIHELLVEAGVNIVFHGHDHFFARQERDGMVYQLVPQPAHRNCRSHSAREYGYETGSFLPNSGHLSVHVEAHEGITVDYVRTATPDMARHAVRNAEVAFTYTLKP